MIIRSLAARLTVLQQALALAVVVVFAGSALALTAHVLRRQEAAYVNQAAQRLARAVDDELTEVHDPVRAAADAVSDQAEPGMQALVRDAQGRLLARTRPPAHAPAGGAAATASARTPGGLTVQVWIQDAYRNAAISALARALLVSALPLLVVSLLLSRWLAGRALRPLSQTADRAARIPIEGGVRTLGVATGLEEIDRLAASFDRLLERLDDALKAERRFTADASHELRTPLTVLSGELELAYGRSRDDPVLQASLASAAGQVRAMRELVEAILLLHRSGEAAPAERTAFEPVNLSDLVREVAAESGARHPGRGADLELAAPDEALVPGHPALLASAVRNLVDNALKFTRHGQAVRITVHAGTRECRIEVEDAGPGIPERERDRVFDPFYRGAEARAGGSGFGLGLPILRRVARAHGGDVVVGDSPLGGARLVLTLPALETS